MHWMSHIPPKAKRDNFSNQEGQLKYSQAFRHKKTREKSREKFTMWILIIPTEFQVNSNITPLPTSTLWFMLLMRVTTWLHFFIGYFVQCGYQQPRMWLLELKLKLNKIQNLAPQSH